MNILYTNNIPDTCDLCELFLSVGWKGTHANERKVTEMLSSRPMFIVSVYDNDKLVGFGKTLEDGIRCLIYDVVVNPSYARQGIGKNIVNQLLAYAKSNGYSYARLFSDKTNPATAPFYKSLGFVNIDNAMQINFS